MGQFSCAVVTGASSGIGLEMAKLLAPRSEKLVLVARRLENLQELAKTLAPCKVEILVHDLQLPGSAQSLWKKLEPLGCSPDLWINNAGFGLSGSYLQTSLEREEEMVQLNVSSLQTLTKLAAQSMSLQKRGTILNIASVAAYQPGPGMAVYFATKSFVLSFSQAVDEELKGTGVRCLALCPGNTHSEFHKVAGSDRSKWMHRFSKMTAAQVAQAAIRQIDTGKRVHIPGIANRLMVAFLPFLPIAWVTRISRFVLAVKAD